MIDIESLKKFNSDIEFISAMNGKHALKFLKQELPDWIFLDVNMPVMNGIETLYAIKKNEISTTHPDIHVFNK